MYMNKYKRFFLRRYYKILYRFDSEKYKKKYPLFLRATGIDIPADYFDGGHGFIAPSTVFDGNDYSLISIGKNTTVSADVIFLTHDYSISKGLKSINAPVSGRFLRPVRVGANSFIGMRTMLLPGTVIGDNVIVGAGSVVRGKFPDNVIVAGNPAKIIGKTDEWAQRHFDARDFQEVPL